MSSCRRVLSFESPSMHFSVVATSPRRSASVSAKSRIDVSGVRSSWETFDTKSLWSRERFASRRTNTQTKTTPVTAAPLNASTKIPIKMLTAASPMNKSTTPSTSKSAVGTTTSATSKMTMRRYPRADGSRVGMAPQRSSWHVLARTGTPPLVRESAV